MKRLASILAILFCTLSLMAQSDANAFLDNVVSRFRKAPGITADFTLKGDVQSGIYMQGVMKMKGQKFAFTTNDMSSWYDGKTMWTYAVGIQEVNITEPTKQELAEVNPCMLLDTYKSSFTVSEQPSNHKGERLFKLVPTKRNTSVKHILLTIATATMSPISFEIVSNSGHTVLVAITNYNDSKALPDAAFTFDASQYNGVEIVDLR